VRVEYITDPTFNNMKVMPIQIPASWRFRGVLVPKVGCADDISEVFRATSPDGQSFAEVMPRIGWKWGKLPPGAVESENGCLPINGPMSAQDFLKSYSTTLQVEYVSDQPVPGQPGAIQTHTGVVTTAMASVRYKKGSTNMKGLLRVNLRCRQFAPMGGQTAGGGRCSAVVLFMAAPESQFSAVSQLWSAPGMGRQKELDDWVAAYSQRYANQLQAETSHWINESDNAFAARQQMYKNAAVAQQRTHDQFMQTMQEGTDRSMAHAAEVANSNHRMASDMVDYSLDRQTVIFPDSGAVVKLPNTVTVDGAQKAHGDGTPW
jgi:hypothetical protein